jgi:hypothetical protein
MPRSRRLLPRKGFGNRPMAKWKQLHGSHPEKNVTFDATVPLNMRKVALSRRVTLTIPSFSGTHKNPLYALSRHPSRVSAAIPAAFLASGW